MRVLVFGGNGQIGHYLVEQCLETGSKVFATYFSTAHRLSPLRHENLATLPCDMRKSSEIISAIARAKPDIIYNVAGKMYAPASWENPLEYFDVNGRAVQVILDTIHSNMPSVVFVNTGSADMYGGISSQFKPITELSQPSPSSPYGVAKQTAYELVKLYRQKKGLNARTAILFNAESEQRERTFFAEKVVFEAVKASKMPVWQPFKIGPLSAVRDWGHAEEYAEVLQKIGAVGGTIRNNRDYIVATGESHSCREFVHEVLLNLGVNVNEENEGMYFIEEKTKERQTEMHANPEVIKKFLGWEAKIKFRQLVSRLVVAEQFRQGKNKKPDFSKVSACAK